MIEGTPTTCHEMIVVIRPSLKKICGNDACRAAAFNHGLYWIARKTKGQPAEKIRDGSITWHATTEEFTEGLADSWGVCKVRQEVNELLNMNLLGLGKNPKWGNGRTRYFFFGEEQCTKLLDLCREHNVCLLHIGLPNIVLDLIQSTATNDKSIVCNCLTNDKSIVSEQEQAFTNDKSIVSQTMNSSPTNDEFITPKTKVSTKDTDKDSNIVASATTPAQDCFNVKQSDAPTDQPAVSEQTTPAAPTKPTRTRKPSKPKETEAQKARIERVYTFFNQLGQEVTGNPDYAYSQTKKDTEAILAWLKSNPTEENLREVFFELWNTPKDPRSGFNWQENMTIQAVLRQYPARVMAIEARRKRQSARVASTTVVYHEEEDDMPFLPPQSLRQASGQRKLSAVK